MNIYISLESSRRYFRPVPKYFNSCGDGDCSQPLLLNPTELRN